MEKNKEIEKNGQIFQAEDSEQQLYEKNREHLLKLVKDGVLPEPRKMTRAERRQLDAANVNIFKIKPDDTRAFIAIREDLADWIIENIYPNFDFTLIDNNVCLTFGEYIFGISYKNDLTAKN